MPEEKTPETSIAPLPVLVSKQKQEAVENVVHELQGKHIVRDFLIVLVILIVAAVALLAASTFIFLGNFSNYEVPMLVFLYFLLGTVSYALVASWGRQPKKIRMQRILFDIVLVGIVLGWCIFVVDARMAMLFFAGNAVAGVLGLLVSFAATPYIDPYVESSARTRFE